MVTPHVIAVGLLPTAHPATGPRLAIRTEDELMQRRLQRTTRRLERHRAQATGGASRPASRAAMVA